VIPLYFSSRSSAKKSRRPTRAKSICLRNADKRFCMYFNAKKARPTRANSITMGKARQYTSDVQNEIKCCLNYALKQVERMVRYPSNASIMSDPLKTIENLRTYLLQRDCSVMVAAQWWPLDQRYRKKTVEHGTWSVCWNLVSFATWLSFRRHAQSAFLSSLVDELMQYDRRNEA
jgi:hypothetical protein